MVRAGSPELLTPLAAGQATAAAIVLFTIAVRLLISPLTVAQVRAERRRAALAPQLRQLQQRYAGRPGDVAVGDVRALPPGRGVAGGGVSAGAAPGALLPGHVPPVRGTGDGADGLLDARLAGVPLGWHLGDGVSPSVLVAFGVLLAALLGLARFLSRRAQRTAASAAPRRHQGAALLARVIPLLPYGTVLWRWWCRWRRCSIWSPPPGGRPRSTHCASAATGAGRSHRRALTTGGAGA